MSAFAQTIQGTGDSRVINAYNQNAALMEATINALLGGKSGEQIAADAGVQAAQEKTDSAIRWFVTSTMYDVGLIIGTIGFDMNWYQPGAGKATFAATTIGARIGAKGGVPVGFMQSHANCVANGGVATLVGVGGALIAGLSAYFFFRGNDFLGFQFGLSVGVDIGILGSLDGKFTAR